MTIIQGIILGITQGLTEFLPVSSSAHLIIVPNLFGWETHSLVFDTTLHLGTSLALIVFFFKDIKTILMSLFIDIKDFLVMGSTHRSFSSNSMLGFKLVIASIPAMILGVLFNDYFETTFRALTWTSIFLLSGSVLMFCAEYLYNKIHIEKVFETPTVSWRSSLIIGVFQSLALFPGMSRSGSTISGGMFLGLSKETAAKFSFLISLPIILGAGIYQLISSSLGELNLTVLLMGFVFSFFSGIVSIKFLLNFLKSNKLYPFVIYRVLLALYLFLFFIK